MFSTSPDGSPRPVQSQSELAPKLDELESGLIAVAGQTSEFRQGGRGKASGIVKNMDVFVERTGMYSQRIPEALPLLPKNSKFEGEQKWN